MLRWRILLGSALLAACGGGAPPPSPSPAPKATTAEPEATAPQPPSPSPSSGLDLPRLDVCARLPPADLAAALGAVVRREIPSEVASASAGCTYELDPAGAEEFEVLIVYVMPPDVFEIARAQAAEGSARAVAGLGDEAFLQVEPEAREVRLQVLKRERFSVEIIAASETSARKAVGLLLERLTE